MSLRGWWVPAPLRVRKDQRSTYKKGNYPAERLERMSALGVKWTAKGLK